jgi:1-acyl-sn-glycerol-3-phosphate acyltransferase
MTNSLPPVKNHVVYVWRIFGKLLSFFLFGIGSVFLLFTVFPVMRLFLHPRHRFQKYGHLVISVTFRLFIIFMFLLGLVTLKAAQKKFFRSLEGKIIVSNHPSLLDVVMLIALIPNADCVVSAYLLHNIVSGIVKQLYIPNSLDFDELSARCVESLRQGNCLILFPEGTRTPRLGAITVKKGAARISLSSGKAIVPVLIRGTDKWGLGKKDPMLAFNHTDRYIYEIILLDEINPETYSDIPVAAAAKRINEDIKNVLFDKNTRERVL